MRITSKLFYRIEAVAFLLYWKKFHFSALEPIAWRLYQKLVHVLCVVLEPFDKAHTLPTRAVLFDISYAKQQQLFARPTASG